VSFALQNQDIYFKFRFLKEGGGVKSQIGISKLRAEPVLGCAESINFNYFNPF